MIQDATAHDMVNRIANGTVTGIADAVRQYFKVDGLWGNRYSEFVQHRFSGSRDAIYNLSVMLYTSNDPALAVIRNEFIDSQLGWPYPNEVDNATLQQIATVFADKLWALAN
jgi:hypothetical protein